MNLPSFNSKKIYQQVFTHRSYLNEAEVPLESNERLEFLGDSVLSLVVSSYIFKNYPNLDEGELTNLRSALTNTQTLFKVAKTLNLGTYLKLSKGEKDSRGQENKTILANTYEALLGGIYLDQGLTEVERFIYETLLLNMNQIVTEENLKDPKSRLQEVVQAKHKASPMYKILKEEGPDHSKTYTIGVYFKTTLLAKGKGSSKQEAEKDAARSALTTLE